jgi:hypothetical protein
MTEKSPDETPAPKQRSLVPQPHGGALLSGGTNKGGPGRTPSAVRKLLRGKFEEHIPTLDAIASGVIPLREKCPKCGFEPEEKPLPIVAPADRLRAIDMMAKHGFSSGMQLDEVREKVTATKDAAEEILPPDLAETFVKEMRRIWLGE